MQVSPKKRGRPRAFDPDEVLALARHTFLRYGYSGASLEALTSSMGLAKPSLYSAFGDKRQLFQRVIEDVAGSVGQRYRAAFERGETLEASLHALFSEAVQLYTTDEEPPGCPILAPSIGEVVVDVELATFIREFFERCDHSLAKWIEPRISARSKSPLNARAIGRLVNGVIHDIAIRARVGESRAKLAGYAKEAAIALSRAA
jgi:AcrR family transcriptional regulator